MGAIPPLSSLIILLTLAAPFPQVTSDPNSRQSPNLATPLSKDDENSGTEHIWCVAKNNADDASLQAAIDWACGFGGVNCDPIQINNPCFDPNNIQSTASFVFNDYYLKNGRSEESCKFSGAAALSSLDPSHHNCRFPFSSVMVANGSFAATGSNSNDTSDTKMVGGWSMASIAIVVLFSLAWLES